MVVKWLVKSCYKGRFSSFLSVASLVKNLKTWRPEICVRLVDRLCELLLRGLEQPSFRDQVKMTGYCRMMGELYVLHRRLFHSLFFLSHSTFSCSSSSSSF